MLSVAARHAARPPGVPLRIPPTRADAGPAFMPDDASGDVAPLTGAEREVLRLDDGPRARGGMALLRFGETERDRPCPSARGYLQA